MKTGINIIIPYQKNLIYFSTFLFPLVFVKLSYQKFVLFFLFVLMASFSTKMNGQTVDSIMHDIQGYWDDYYDQILQTNGTLEGTDYTKYQRWLWFWKSRLSEGGTLTEAAQAYTEYLLSSNTSSLQLSPTGIGCNSSALWSTLGPDEFPPASNYQAGIGVTNYMVFHPDYNGTTNQTIYVLSEGGLWQSTNDGGNWTQVNTSSIGVEACSDLGIGHQDPDIMYLGTGLHYSNLTSLFGDPYQSSLGIYRSTDGGNSWSFSGPENQPWTFNDQRKIARVLVRPGTDNIVYACVYYHSWTGGSHWEGDLYKTIDGGQTWHLIFHTNQGMLRDMEFHPTNPNTFYVSGQRAFRFNDTANNTNTITPTDITNNLTGYVEYNQPGRGHVANIQIAVTPDAPDNLYAVAFAVAANESLDNDRDILIQNLWISNNQGQ